MKISNKHDKNFLYDVAKVAQGVDYWFYKLLAYCLNIYEVDGLPESLPAREVLMNLILTGHAVIFKDKGKLVTTKTTLYDFDLYYRPTKATYGNVKLFSKTLNLGSDSEVVYLNKIQGNVLTNQAVDSGLATFISRYAKLLADVESTLSIYLVNMRLSAFPVAKTQAIKDNIIEFFRKLEAGERAVITDDLVIEAFKAVEIAGTRVNDRLNDIIIARDKILAMFFRDIGIKMEQPVKMAQLTDDEVNADDRLLVINVEDMLQEMKEGFERVNKMFGTNVSIKISDRYKKEVKEDNTDGNTNDQSKSESEGSGNDNSRTE